MALKTITFANTDDAKRVVLAMMGKTVDDDGYIVEKSTGERVLTPSNEEITLESFAGVRPGSEVFITNDLPSILEQEHFVKA